MRVLLADDHSIIRNALKFILQDLEAEVTFEEAPGYPSLEDRLAAEGPPLDMVVMDLQMPGYEGLAQIRRIVERAAPTPIAVFSMMEAVEDMRVVLRQGVRAFIPKSTDEALIGTLLKLVAGGGTYVPAQVSGITGARCSAPP
ncbi:response regulator, partial [Rhodospirillum rubrum]